MDAVSWQYPKTLSRFFYRNHKNCKYITKADEKSLHARRAEILRIVTGYVRHAHDKYEVSEKALTPRERISHALKITRSALDLQYKRAFRMVDEEMETNRWIQEFEITPACESRWSTLSADLHTQQMRQPLEIQSVKLNAQLCAEESRCEKVIYLSYLQMNYRPQMVEKR